MMKILIFLLIGSISFVLGQEILVYSLNNTESSYSFKDYSNNKYSEQSIQDIAIHGWVKIGDMKNAQQVSIFYFYSSCIVDDQTLDYSRMSLKIIDTFREHYFTVSTYTKIPQYNQKHYSIYFDDNDRNSWIFFFMSHSNNLCQFKIYVQFPQKQQSHNWDQIYHEINSKNYQGLIGRDIRGHYFYGDLMLFTLHVSYYIQSFYEKSKLNELTAINPNDQVLCPIVFNNQAYTGQFKKYCDDILPTGDWILQDIKSIFIPQNKNLMLYLQSKKSIITIKQKIEDFDYQQLDDYESQQIIKFIKTL